MDIDLSLQDYWRILKRRKWIVLFISGTTFLSVFFYTQVQTPIYSAQAMVKFEPPGSKLPGTEMTNWDMWTQIQTEVRVLQSVGVAERAAKKMGWSLEKVQGSYQVKRVEQSNLLAILTTGVDPARAAGLANAVAEAYIERDLEERSRHARKSLEDVVARRQDLEESLQDLEEERQAFLEKHQTTRLGTSMASLLLDLESRRKEMMKKYTPEHPEMIKLEQRIQAAKSQLSRLPSQETELERITRDLRVNEEVYKTLSRQTEEAKIALASVVSFVTVISRATAPLNPVSPRKGLNYGVGAVLGIFLGFLVAFILENLDISISTLEEIEKVLEVPVLGIIPHFSTDKKWGSLLAKIMRKQRYPTDLFRSLLIFHHKTKSPFIEVYHSLRA
ncbi:MAG: GumC family protein, partial [Elusimicrobia bacterium]|nr:GumC family protein [Elusimicrobiota bacterium]